MEVFRNPCWYPQGGCLCFRNVHSFSQSEQYLEVPPPYAFSSQWNRLSSEQLRQLSARAGGQPEDYNPSTVEEKVLFLLLGTGRACCEGGIGILELEGVIHHATSLVAKGILRPGSEVGSTLDPCRASQGVFARHYAWRHPSGLPHGGKRYEDDSEGKHAPGPNGTTVCACSPPTSFGVSSRI